MSKPWPKVRLGEVVKYTRRAETPYPGTCYRQIGVKLWGQGAYERESIDGSQTKYAQLFRAEEGDIIVNKIWARNGSVAVVSASLAGSFGSGEFPMFTPNRQKLEPRWVHWLTQTRGFWSQCDEKSRGTSGKNRIKPEQFLSVEIPLPPLSEQQSIIGRIDEASAQISQAQVLRQQSSAEVAALVGARSSELFRHMATRGTVSLGMAAILERGKFSYRPRNDPRFFGGSHPWIQIGEIESAGKIIRQHTETLNDEGLAISKKFPRGTVLISIAATIGSVGILNFDCCVPDSIVGVTPREGTDSHFLYHFLNFLRGHLDEKAPRSAQKNINLQILSQLPVPRLTLSEQRHVVAELDALQTQVDELIRLQSETAAELDAMLPALLDRAFMQQL